MMHKNAYKPTCPPVEKISTVTASVVGARGYAGLELSRLLLRHPSVKFTHAFATQAFALEKEIFAPGAAQVECFTDDKLFDHLTDVVFLATPAEVSACLAPKVVAAGKRVIDLSGAFRLSPDAVAQWYGLDSTNSGLSVCDYGLNPFCGPAPADLSLVANPGCYATAVSLALIPLLKHGLVHGEGLVIDAKSGATGAGRKAGENLLFSQVDGECLPYRVGRHQHLPEIVQAARRFGGRAIDPHFVTHLLPTKRGITAGIYGLATTDNLARIEEAYASEFAGYPLVRHSPEIATLARLDHVVHTPYTHISYALTGNKLYVFAAIDNLLKGAASQAVENLNRLLDLPAGYSLIEEA